MATSRSCSSCGGDGGDGHDDGGDDGGDGGDDDDGSDGGGGDDGDDGNEDDSDGVFGLVEFRRPPDDDGDSDDNLPFRKFWSPRLHAARENDRPGWALLAVWWQVAKAFWSADGGQRKRRE